jgi:hypothetical protein
MDNEKLIYSIVTLNEKLDGIQKGFDEIRLSLESKGHSNNKKASKERLVLKELREEISNLPGNLLANLLAQGAEQIQHKVHDLLVAESSQLRARINDSLGDLQGIGFKTLFKNYVIAFLLGFLIAGAGSYYFVARHMKVFSDREKKNLLIGEVYSLGWRHLKPDIRKEIYNAASLEMDRLTRWR